MSVEALALVLHHSRAKGTAKLVLIGIANHAGDGGSWPTHKTLAKYANVSERNVRQAIARLVELREVSIEGQAGGTRECPDNRRPNRYTVLVVCPSWCDRTSQHRDTRRRQTALPAPPLSTGGSESTTQDTSGGSEATTLGGSLSTTKPSLEPEPTKVEPQLQDTRDLGRCSICSQPEYRCQRAQIHWSPEDRHPYTPEAKTQQREGATG